MGEYNPDWESIAKREVAHKAAARWKPLQAVSRHRLPPAGWRQRLKSGAMATGLIAFRAIPGREPMLLRESTLRGTLRGIGVGSDARETREASWN